MRRPGSRLRGVFERGVGMPSRSRVTRPEFRPPGGRGCVFLHASLPETVREGSTSANTWGTTSPRARCTKPPHGSPQGIKLYPKLHPKFINLVVRVHSSISNNTNYIYQTLFNLLYVWVLKPTTFQNNKRSQTHYNRYSHIVQLQNTEYMRAQIKSSSKSG